MAGSIRAKLQLTGNRELRKTFQLLSRAIQNRVAKSALQAGARPIVRAARQFAPIADATQTHRGIPVGVGRGLLKKSIGSRGKVSRKGKFAYVVVGPRRKKFKTLIGMTKDGAPVYMNPTNYSHLMEGGHDIKIGGRVVAHFPGTQFMERAWDASRAEAQSAIEAKFAEGVEREAAKAIGV